MKRKESAEVEGMLEELKRASSELGLEVREEEILREVGYRARSGVCRVGDRTVVVIDRRLSGQDRIELLCRALAEHRGADLERVFLSPVLRARLSGMTVARELPLVGGPAESDAPAPAAEPEPEATRAADSGG